ncbi:MAG: shikimate dehydrogenase [Hyphomicrobiaceae bacterium]
MADTTPSAVVIGWPIEHSRSPIIHGYWLETLGICGQYHKRAVPPDELEAFVDEVRRGALSGANVTIPHKVAIAACVDEVLPEATAIGAVNTLWVEAGRVLATNTDGTGFLANLDQTAPQWRASNRRVLILGAGGAARAIADALIRCGVERIDVANRTFERAEDLAARLRAVHGSKAKTSAVDWAEAPSALTHTDLLINTTSLGMAGQPALLFDLGCARADAIVADIVYVPLETELLAAARGRGLVTVDGLGMLLHQAAPGFARWFGVMPQVTDGLRQRVLADIGS